MVDLIEQQASLETEMMNLGRDRFEKLLDVAKDNDKEATTPYGKDLMKRVVEPLASAITAFCSAPAGRGGQHVALKYLKKLDPKVAAFITGKVIIDKISSRRTSTMIALTIANQLEDEVRFAKFEEQNKALFRAALKSLRQATGSKNNEQAIRDRMVRIHNDATENSWKPWPKPMKLHLGNKCIDLFIENTHWVELHKVNEGHNNSINYLVPTAEIGDWIKNKAAQCELLEPTYLPTVVKPKPWCSAYEGGYYFLPHQVQPTLVKTRNKRYLEELNHRWDDIQIPVRALNALQETPWQVNSKVLDVAQFVWEKSLGIAEIAPSEDLDLPPKPLDIETNEEARKAWRKDAASIYETNVKMRSQRLAVLKTIYLAGKFRDQSAIYFPHTFDWRGRAYPLPMWLHPQSNDLARGMLQFAEGKPLNTEAALRWFKVHGANTYGVDKAPFDERVAWVNANEALILSVAANPYEDRRWADADSPFQFLAWAFEYAAWHSDPFFVSHIPVAMDGSCNGLQHWSAVLRDHVGGAAVNLVPAAKPKDIYKLVAEKTILSLREEAESGGEDADLATIWLNYGIDRKTAKRPVMIVPYSGTIFSCRDYIEADVEANRSKVFPINKREDRARWNAAMHYLAKVMWAAISNTVIAARNGMDWMTKLARVAAAEGLPIVWTTPVGFPVQQSYLNTEKRRVKTRIGNSLVYATLIKDTDEIDRKKQASGIAPNFIHSLDAAALQSYVVKCLDAGITSFAAIHDSYGVLAADVEVSNHMIRESFVELYRDNDVLSDLRKSVEDMVGPEKAKAIRPIPEAGDLDLSEVMASGYFFA